MAHPTPDISNAASERYAAFFGPERISQEVVDSLQAASGIRCSGLEMTLYALESSLNDLLAGPWRKVRSTLDCQDLLTVAQMFQGVDATFAFRPNWMESVLQDTDDPEIDREGAEKLLPKLRTWDMATRWAVYRAMANCLAEAQKESSCPRILLNSAIEAAFRKALAA